MDKLKTIVLFLLISQTFAYSQDKGGVIEYDLGQIKQSEVIQKKYEIKEEIKSAVSLCECVKVNVTKKTNTSLIEIEFDPSGYKGLTSEEIKLLDKNDNIITLKLKAYVEG